MTTILKHDKKEYKIKKINEEDSFLFKSKSTDTIINIYDKETIESIINSRFNKKYYEFISQSLSIINEEDDESNASITLSEIDKFRSYIIRNYKKYISEAQLNKYLKKLDIISGEIDSYLKEKTEYIGKGR